MKGYCKCGKEIDEVEFTEFGSCIDCFKIKRFGRIVKLNKLADELEKTGLILTSNLIKNFIKEYIELKGIEF